MRLQVGGDGRCRLEITRGHQHPDRRAQDHHLAFGIAILGEHSTDEGSGGTDVALGEAQQREARARVMAVRGRIAVGLVGEGELPA